MPRVRRPTPTCRIAALAFGMTGVAEAQVPEQPGFYAGATGLWRWNWGDRAGPGAGLTRGRAAVRDSAASSATRRTRLGTMRWVAVRMASQRLVDRRRCAARYVVTLPVRRPRGRLQHEHGQRYRGPRVRRYSRPALQPGRRRRGDRHPGASQRLGVGPRIGIGGQTFLTRSVGLVGSVDGSLLAGPLQRGRHAQRQRLLAPGAGGRRRGWPPIPLRRLVLAGHYRRCTRRCALQREFW